MALSDIQFESCGYLKAVPSRSSNRAWSVEPDSPFHEATMEKAAIGLGGANATDSDHIATDITGEGFNFWGGGRIK